MNESIRTSIRRIFLNPRPHVALIMTADLLGMPFPVLKREIAEGTIVAVSVGVVGLRVSKEELIAAAMRIWPQAVIEEALGDAAATVLPEAIRLVELRARVQDWIVTVEENELLQYDVVTVKDLVFAQLRSWC